MYVCNIYAGVVIVCRRIIPKTITSPTGSGAGHDSHSAFDRERGRSCCCRRHSKTKAYKSHSRYKSLERRP